MGTNVVVAIIGFTGVIITLVVNACLARKQQERQWENERKQRDEARAHEHAILRQALLAELQGIYGTLKQGTGAIDANKTADILIPATLENCSIYKGSVSRIGLLSEREVRAVVTAYRGFETQIQKLHLIGKPEENAADHLRIGAASLPRLSSMMIPVLQDVKAAIDILHSGLSPSADG